VCQGKFQEAVELFITGINAVVRKYEGRIRLKAKDQLGDWQAIKILMAPYPYTFAFELVVLNHLINHPQDWAGALGSISEQVKMWVYAYMSYLLNLQLSTYSLSGQPPPPELPIPLSDDINDRQPFAEFLAQDSVSLDFPTALSPLPFIQRQHRTLHTLITPTVHTWKITPVGLVISFDLPTGAYATTALRNLFLLEVDEPAPAWVPTDAIDPKAILGTGTLEPLRQQFGSAFEPRTTYSTAAE
jgi:tRNA(Glu) U13 pseudouridine synthase TruD